MEDHRLSCVVYASTWRRIQRLILINIHYRRWHGPERLAQAVACRILVVDALVGAHLICSVKAHILRVVISDGLHIALAIEGLRRCKLWQLILLIVCTLDEVVVLLRWTISVHVEHERCAVRFTTTRAAGCLSHFVLRTDN